MTTTENDNSSSVFSSSRPGDGGDSCPSPFEKMSLCVAFSCLLLSALRGFARKERERAGRPVKRITHSQNVPSARFTAGDPAESKERERPCRLWQMAGGDPGEDADFVREKRALSPPV